MIVPIPCMVCGGGHHSSKCHELSSPMKGGFASSNGYKDEDDCDESISWIFYKMLVETQNSPDDECLSILQE